MKVSVSATINYQYEVEIAEPWTAGDLFFCDSADPVYSAIAKTMADNHIQFDGSLNSIVKEDTGEVLWDGDY